MLELADCTLTVYEHHAAMVTGSGSRCEPCFLGDHGHVGLDLVSRPRVLVWFGKAGVVR